MLWLLVRAFFVIWKRYPITGGAKIIYLIFNLLEAHRVTDVFNNIKINKLRLLQARRLSASFEILKLNWSIILRGQSKFLRPIINLVSTFIFFYQTGSGGVVEFHVKAQYITRNMLRDSSIPAPYFIFFSQSTQT